MINNAITANLLKNRVMEDYTKQIQLKWKVGYNTDKDAESIDFVPAQVPGAVQLDIARAKQYPDYKYSDNFKLFKWMEDMYYTYQTTFEKPHLSDNDRICFVSKGIDYEFDIWLNNKKIHSQEGMFMYVDLDLTNLLQEKNTLQIKVYPAPKREGFPEDRTQASASVKPAVSYGWDWHPRLIPLGIWDETFLEIRSSSNIKDVYVSYQLAEDFSKADITLYASAKLETPCSYEWQLIDKSGNEVLRWDGEMDKKISIDCTLNSPQLWWTHDHGTPYLYKSCFKLKRKTGEIISENVQKVGFRRIRLVMNEGAWDEPKQFPKSRSVVAAQFELNGKNIFAKGTNWVNSEIFPGTITSERYEELVKIAVDTNFNIVRA